MIIIIIVIIINFVRDDARRCFSPESNCSGSKKAPQDCGASGFLRDRFQDETILTRLSGAAEYLFEMRFQALDIGLERRILDHVIAHEGRKRLETDKLVRLMETEERGVDSLPFEELIRGEESVQRRVPGGADHVAALQLAAGSVIDGRILMVTAVARDHRGAPRHIVFV